MRGYANVGATAGSLELEVTGGPGAGQQFSVHEDFRVGSGESGPGALGGDRWLSASHALFHRGPDGWAVEDLRSLEGTQLNGQALRGAATLAPGDVVELGSSRIVVLPDAGTSAASMHAASPGGMAEVRRAEKRRELDGKRVIAFLLDTLVLVPLLVPVYGMLLGRVLLLWLAVIAFTLTYFFVCEALFGQTLGKRIAKLRVVRVDGRPLNPRSVAGRTVLRLVDQQIGCLVGLLTMILTGERRQRLGDLAGRTAVTRASAPFPPIARRGRERIAVWGYPAMWLAPLVLLFVLFPDARLESCQDARISAGSPREGDCIVYTRSGSGVFQVVNTGHTLRLPDVSAQLVRTRVRRGPNGSLAVGFRLALRNTGDRPLRFDADLRHVMLTAPRPDGSGPGAVREIPVSVRRALMRPGARRTVWLSFPVPSEVLPQLREPNAALVFMPGVDGLSGGGLEHLGEIRLWTAATPAGVRALSRLRD